MRAINFAKVFLCHGNFSYNFLKVKQIYCARGALESEWPREINYTDKQWTWNNKRLFDATSNSLCIAHKISTIDGDFIKKIHHNAFFANHHQRKSSLFPILNFSSRIIRAGQIQNFIVDHRKVPRMGKRVWCGTDEDSIHGLSLLRALSWAFVALSRLSARRRRNSAIIIEEGQIVDIRFCQFGILSYLTYAESFVRWRRRRVNWKNVDFHTTLCYLPRFSYMR